jgi:hypothetical protein
MQGGLLHSPELPEQGEAEEMFISNRLLEPLYAALFSPRAELECAEEPRISLPSYFLHRL